MVHKNQQRTYDLNRAEMRLHEEIRRLKRRFAALEAAVEHIKLCSLNPAPSSMRQQGGAE